MPETVEGRAQQQGELAPEKIEATSEMKNSVLYLNRDEVSDLSCLCVGGLVLAKNPQDKVASTSKKVLDFLFSCGNGRPFAHGIRLGAAQKVSFITRLVVLALAVNSALAANVTLDWNASTNQAVTGYVIRYGIGNPTNSFAVQKTNSVTIAGLLPDTQYLLSIAARTATGESAFSPPIPYRTPPLIQVSNVVRVVTISITNGTLGITTNR